MAQNVVNPNSVSTPQKRATVEIQARPLSPMVLNEQPQELKLNIADIPTLNNNKLRGVKFKAYARHVVIDGQGISQIMLTGVEKNGEVVSFDNPADLSIQQISKNSEINPDKSAFTFEADPQILNAALTQLHTALEKKQGDNADDKAKEKINDRGSASGQQSASSNAGGNKQADSYSSPDDFRLAEKKEPVITTSTTSDGCNITVDYDQQVAIVYEKAITYTDGAKSGETKCSESLTRYPLQKSYGNCDASINLDDKKAIAQFQYYYVNGSAQRVDTGECQDDTELAFDIVEKHDNCAIFIDVANEKAVPQARLIYENDKNQQIEVRGCRDSEEKEAVPMVMNTHQCGIVHDFTRGLSKQQGAWIYALGDSYYQASACIDTDTTYDHDDVYYNSAGAPICTPIIDQQSKTVTLSSRVAITVNGLQSFIKECTPDTDNRLNMTATTDGCTDPSTWTHNISTSQSFGKERYYYMLNNQREYVTNCIDSDTVYNHESALAAYQYHDANLHAFPLYDIWITTSQGRYNIETSHLIAGTQKIDYVNTGFTDNPNGQFTYAGCDKTQATTRTTHYDRPDDSKYDVVGGAGTPLSAVYSCTVGNKLGFTRTSSVLNDNIAGTQTFRLSINHYEAASSSATGISGYRRTGSASASGAITRANEVAKYKGQRELVRDDGHKITETSTREFTVTHDFGSALNNNVTVTISSLVRSYLDRSGNVSFTVNTSCHARYGVCSRTYSASTLDTSSYPNFGTRINASDTRAIGWYADLGW